MSISNLSVPNRQTVSCRCFTCDHDGMQYGNNQGTTLLDFNPAGCTMDFAHCTVLNFPGVGPLPTITQTVYVSQGGSDLTGNGTILAPYATITHALSTITDASSSKFYAVNVGPGQYNVGTLHLKPFIVIVGDNITLIGNFDVNDPSWVSGMGQFAAISSCALVGNIIIDFTVNSILDGQVYFRDCEVINQLQFTGNGVGGTNGMFVLNSILPGGFIQNGGSMNMSASSVIGGSCTVNAITGSVTNFSAYGGGCNALFHALWTVGQGNLNLLFLPFSMNGHLILDGLNCVLTAPTASIPANLTLANNASIIYIDTNSLNNPNQWSDVNVTVGSLASGQTLQWNTGLSKWVNGDVVNANTYTPTVSGTANVTINNSVGTYIMIGNVVTVQYYFNINVTGIVGGNLINCDIPLPRTNSGNFTGNDFGGQGCEQETIVVQNPVYVSTLATSQLLTVSWQATAITAGATLAFSFMYTI